MRTPLLVDAEVKPFEVPECVCIYVHTCVARALKGSVRRNSTVFGMYELCAILLQYCGMVQARAGNERLWSEDILVAT